MNFKQTKLKTYVKFVLLSCCAYGIAGFQTTHAQIFHDEFSPYEVNSVNGNATWQKDETSGDYVYNNGGTQYTRRAVMYSTESFQSNDGFILTVEYTTGTIDVAAAHNFSFGLISDEIDLASFTGFNPYKSDLSVYSIGANLTADDDATARGLNFTNGTERITLDESGTRTQFVAGEKTKVTIEIGIGGSWTYRINDVYEASGVIADGIDLTKKYHVAIYGQDDQGGGKSIQSITLEKNYAQGERANKLRGTWNSEIDIDLLDDRIKNLKTLDRLGVSFTNGAVLSAEHFAPHKLFDMLPGGDAVAPAWGNLNSDKPENDKLLTNILKAKEAGFNVKAYTNSENFVGENSEYLQQFVDSWIEYCDTDPEIQAFINSQPYHTAIWNEVTGEYEDASETFPMRKYMFCYAEYFLKDFAIRYGEHFDSWIFDDGGTMEQNGDNAASGLIEEQRIYQAYANAVHAGNPDIAIAFNNGRSTVNYDAYPYAHPTRFDDFTFGHAFGGNNNHAEKIEGNQFDLNYQHITRMTETNGSVHSGGNWDWDDKIVGNFHSKLSTTAWKYGATQAWEQDDFNQWNLEAIQAGGSMTWGGSYNRTVTAIYDWVYVLLEGMDNYLMTHESPGSPNWSKAHTILPDAIMGQPYSHTLVEGTDFWDPEGDKIISLLALEDFPSWLTISEPNSGVWILSGTPSESIETNYEFKLEVSDATSGTERVVELKILDPDSIGVTDVIISKDQYYLTVNENVELSAQVMPENAANQSVIWSSSDSSIASVDENGVVEAHTLGNVIITVSTVDGGYNSECAISVLESSDLNLALNGVATQSSTDYGGEPSRAIDGNTDGVFGNNSVTHTQEEENPWWQVDLGDEYSIGDINLYNRVGTNYTRLSNFTISIINSEGTEVYSELVEEAPNLTSTISIQGVVGQVVRIQLNTINVLSLAEVEVFKFDSALSIDTIENTFKLYPNPATDVLNYDFKNVEGFNQIIIFSILGKQVSVENVKTPKGQIDISNLKSGFYILKVVGRTNFVMKFIKE
ncbi:galactose-binding domain-containing protein [Formosa haliotis]|uniref:galactose-binding domain-containing protein n=1 Tax=Formosa haliotis TaxID=1555194 RepID=UPI0008245E4C|nr:T9SS type A sorting domain-containing protein [Formosa haliotis]